MAGSAQPVFYRHRRPEKSVLYRALAQHFDELLRVYAERFEPAYGYLRSCIEPVVHRYLDCGLPERGFARLECDGCGHSAVLAFSCKQRCLCPSCHMKRELLWAEWAEEELLEEVPHRQVVCTIPKRLRIFFRYDRRLLGELTACAWRAVRRYLDAYFDSQEVTPGGVGFVQTHGELLRWHPHVHLLIADGGWLPDGSFRHLLYFDSTHVERLFRAEVLRLLREKGKISTEHVEQILSWPRSGFSVHGAVRVEDKKQAARLGRYMIRCPLVLERLDWEEQHQQVVFRAHPRKAASPYGSVARWDVLDFLAHLTQHIPEPRAKLTRYWARYSNAARGKRRRQAKNSQLPTQHPQLPPASAAARKRRLSWARLIQKVFEIDPLLCDYCGSTMKVRSFTLDFAEIRRFLSSIGEQPQEVEALAHSPPAKSEPVYELLCSR